MWFWSKGFCFLLQQAQMHVLQPFSFHLTQKQTASLEENSWRIKAWLCCQYWSDLDPSDNKHFTFMFSNSGFLWRQMSLECRRVDTFLLLMISRMIPQAQLYIIVEGDSHLNPTFQFQLSLHSKTNKIKHQCFAISSTAVAGTIDSHHLCRRKPERGKPSSLCRQNPEVLGNAKLLRKKTYSSSGAGKR
jgi:hypothetical protein